MKKRSAYRPKPKLINPLMYVLESLKPVREHDSYLIDLKIKNHGAMSNLTKGVATRDDMELLIGMVNVAEALYRLGYGKEYKQVVKDGLDALDAVGKRGVTTGRFILRAQEMSDLNTIMELHDAQMELITVKEMERVTDMINEDFRNKKMRTFMEKTA